MANNISSTVRGMLPNPTGNTGHYVEQKAAAQPEKTKTLPQSGGVLPQQATQQPAANEGVELEEAVNRINDYVQSVQRDLSFSMDDATGRTVIKVMDRSSGEVIRQIPSDEVLALATYLGDQAAATSKNGEALQGLLFSQTT
ncbi:MAG: flagellar protein FlaG [Gammaproteobacteria bacterium]|nr:flagellar protein FlaG [Gammaproteobacteria bacterium]